MNPCEPNHYCSEIDDYRPIQSTLLTRFTSTDSSDLWRTTNQDYGAFYYRSTPDYCVPDNLKSKICRRHHRFQDWLTYQTNNNHNTPSIFPSNRNETVRITHRKRFVPTCHDTQNNRNCFSPCGEAGLITEYMVKKILSRLQYLIRSDEQQEVIECAQMLVSEILTDEPSLGINEIIDRVITIMITPPNHIPPSSCASPELPLNTTVSTTGPLINCNESIFEKLTHLENAISKLSHPVIQC